MSKRKTLKPSTKISALEPKHWRAFLGALAIIASISLFVFNQGRVESRDEVFMYILLVGTGYLLIDKASFKEVISVVGDKLAFWRK